MKSRRRAVRRVYVLFSANQTMIAYTRLNAITDSQPAITGTWSQSSSVTSRSSTGTHSKPREYFQVN